MREVYHLTCMSGCSITLAYRRRLRTCEGFDGARREDNL